LLGRCFIPWAVYGFQPETSLLLETALVGAFLVFAEGLAGFGGAFGFAEGMGEVEPGVGVVWVDAHGFLEGKGCLGVVADFVMDETEEEPGIVEAAVDLKATIQGGEGCGVISESGLGDG
jgi:hypothetical protein